MQDVFDHIKEIEKGNFDFYKNLSDDEKKTVSHYMLLKWMTYTDDPKQILHINAFVNTKLFALSQHKDLLFKLFCASATKKKHYYKWLKRNPKRESNTLKMVSDAHNCGLKEAEEILALYTKAELLELCSDMNFDKVLADKIKKEIDVL